MEETTNENKILLHGRLEDTPKFSHASRDLQFYTAPIRVMRLSGSSDLLNILMPTRMTTQYTLNEGTELTVLGQIRTYNNRTSTGPRLIMSVHAQQLILDERLDENIVTLQGTLCKNPIYRRTPLGRDICDFTLAVGRPYGRADYIPCIAWGSLAVQCATLEAGAPLAVDGRLQSRIYSKVIDGTPEERTAYEVSIMRLR